MYDPAMYKCLQKFTKNWNLIFADEKRGGEEGSFAPRKDSLQEDQNKGNLTLDVIVYIKYIVFLYIII